MRRKYYPGEAVVEGIYWNTNTWEFIENPEGGLLPKEDGVAYYRVPRAVVLLVGPLLGLVYVLFLPFAALPLAAYAGLRAAARAVTSIRSGRAEGKAGNGR